MPQAVPITDFSAGELSPRLRGRIDAPIYQRGLETSYNYTSIPFGGLTRRPGSWYIDDISTDFSVIADTALEVPFQNNLFDDVMLIVFQDSSDNITMIPVIFGSTVTIGTKRTLANTFPGVVGSDTKWARTDDDKVHFASKQVRPFTITNDGTSDGWSIDWTAYALPQWDVNYYYGQGMVVEYSSADYVAKDASTQDEANVGQVPSTSPLFWNAAYASGATEPDFMVNAATEGTDALKSLWYPSCICTWMGRIIYGGSIKEPMALWGSGIKQYEFFVMGINDNSPWKHTLSNTDSGAIQWLLPADVLIIGTPTAEFVITGNQFGITASNIQVQTSTAHGSSPVQPLLFNEQVIFTKQDRQQIVGYSYMDTIARFYGQELTKAADHIHATKIVSSTLVRNPRISVLSVTGDGRLIQMAYDRTLNQIAFYPWQMERDREIVSVGALPSAGDEDRIVVVVKDDTTYTVEVFHWTDFYLHDTSPIVTTNSYTSGMYLDQAVEIEIKEDASGFYADGLANWNGLTLDVVVGHSPHPPQTVATGVIRLDHDGDFGYVGFNYESYAQSMNIPPSMLVKRVNQYGIRFIQTVGGKVGPSYDDMENMIFRDGEQYYDTALEQYSGDFLVDNVGGFDRDIYIWFGQDVAAPQTVLQVVAWIERYE